MIPSLGPGSEWRCPCKKWRDTTARQARIHGVNASAPWLRDDLYLVDHAPDLSDSVAGRVEVDEERTSRPGKPAATRESWRWTVSRVLFQ
jgi:hypothetical protein